MKPSTQLALWLLLTADAMFLIGLFGAGQVLPQNTVVVGHWNLLIVASLAAGRMFLQFKPRQWGLFGLIAIGCFGMEIFQIRYFDAPSDVARLLEWIFAIHFAALAVASLALAEGLTLLWNFVLGLGIVLLLGVR